MGIGNIFVIFLVYCGETEVVASMLSIIVSK